MTQSITLLPLSGLAHARACLAGNTPACLVRVIAVKGSVPRETDAVLVVDATHFGGTIGGGHLEHEAIRIAREFVLADTAQPFERRFPLGPSLGQCCGGAVELRFSRLQEQDLAMLAALEDAPDELWLYGAGHVARALVHTMLPLPFKIHWVDEREELFPDHLPDHVVVHAGDSPVDEVASAGAGAYHLVMTHSHALDFDLVQAILLRGDAAWCGLIGSATKRVTFERRLLARGLAPERLPEMVCPVGLADITSKLPAVIAVSVAAQLLSLTANKAA